MRVKQILRALLVLGRVSNLPTVWSNCLAGWWLGGAVEVQRLPWLFAGATFLYVGGMYLNDAFDAEFDRQYRAERPIVSGQISRAAVWRWGFAWLGLGALSLIWLGTLPGALGLGLVCCILLYDALHKQIPGAPLLMSGCRFLLYLVAASTGARGVTGSAIWCGLALAAYIVGLSYLARVESAGGKVDYWPLVLVGSPIGLALLLNVGAFRETAWLIVAILALWIVKCLRPIFWTSGKNIGQTVAGLLAGIVFVDWLAMADAPKPLGLVMLALFLAALVLQRFIPAT